MPFDRKLGKRGGQSEKRKQSTVAWKTWSNRLAHEWKIIEHVYSGRNYAVGSVLNDDSLHNSIVNETLAEVLPNFTKE